MTRKEETAKSAEIATKVLLCVLCVLCGFFRSSSATAQPAGPVIVVETVKGTFELETYPADAPKTVAHIVDLVKRGFYDGQRIHRALPGFLVQWGDPRSRDLSREADWGRGADASNGHPVGVSELQRKHLHTRGAVAMAHQGNPALADSQIYVTLEARPDLDNRYTVFGHITAGDDVPAQLERGDLIRRIYLKE
ncbi:MAG TPA: peptidylprolyl isomerase [Vicinamibacterales bacterium]|jgi:cyclophilin family peptidyl-prolyl cis-trans isomerase|nr:peptidylprolyl isomerase [Vicinamibacterales bacterium]